MKFPRPLVRGTLIRRYKRFLADIRLEDGRAITAHCANPGAMLGVADPGLPVWLLESSDPRRKLRWSWELVRTEGTLLGVNTALPNRLVPEALARGGIAELTGYDTVRREVAYGLASRVDLLLSAPGRPICYLEIKNVHLRRGDRAEFPDCVTERGAKHMAELAAMARAGHRAVVLFVVQRDDCGTFRVAGDLDPAYNRAFEAARQAGVEALCYACEVSEAGIDLARSLPLESWTDGAT
jgi:sugar fermentation stimulation protein A